MAERVYLFLNCADVRRIRSFYLKSDPVFMNSWNILRGIVDDYRAKFPTQFNPDDSSEVLWWGAGNYMARDMAIIYLVTGDEQYGRDIVRLLELVRTNTPAQQVPYTFFAPAPGGSEFSGGLLSDPRFGEVVYQSVLFSYQAVRDSSLMDDNQRQTYDAFFMNQAELLEQAAILRGNDSSLDSTMNRNLPLGANVAALTIAIAFPDNVDMQQLYQRVRPRLDWQLAYWWETDGGWGEDTEEYGFRVLEGLSLFAEALLKTDGENLYEEQFDGRSMHEFCSFFLDVLTPIGTTPALNESSHFFVDPGLFDLCGYRTGDAQLYFTADQYRKGQLSAYEVNTVQRLTPFHSVAWVGLRDQEVQFPAFNSILLPATGAAILRGGWETQNPYALLQFTASKVHEEFSFGALYLYANGPWLVGNGYELKVDEPTNQHSTLSFDDLNQTNTGGKAVAFADLGQTGIAAVRAQSYSNLEHTRSLLWIKHWGQWIVVDDAVSDPKIHTLQLRWYVRGDYQNTDNNLWTFTRKADVNTLLSIQMLPERTAKYTKISRQYDLESFVSDAVGVEMETSYPGKPVRLVSALTVSTNDTGAPTVTRKDSASATSIASAQNGERWLWMLTKSEYDKGTVLSDSLTGFAACTHYKAKILQGYCLMNGSRYSSEGFNLIASNHPVYLEADFLAGEVQIEATIKSTITFYWPEKATAIMDSNAPVDFLQGGSLINLTVSPGQHDLIIN
jgi:hypothetical protein